LVILGPPNDCSMMTLRPTRDTSANQRATDKSALGEEQTFRPKRNTNSVCKHVNALEDARAAFVGKLNFLVGAAGEDGASGLRGSTTERAGGARRDVMHGVLDVRKLRGEGRRTVGVFGRGWGKRKGREKYAAKRPFIICSFVWLSLTECYLDYYIQLRANGAHLKHPEEYKESVKQDGGQTRTLAQASSSQGLTPWQSNSISSSSVKPKPLPFILSSINASHSPSL